MIHEKTSASVTLGKRSSSVYSQAIIPRLLAVVTYFCIRDTIDVQFAKWLEMFYILLKINGIFKEVDS